MFNKRKLFIQNFLELILKLKGTGISCTNIPGFKIQVMNQFTRRICYEIPPTEAVLHSCNSLYVFTMCFAFAYLVAESPRLPPVTDRPAGDQQRSKTEIHASSACSGYTPRAITRAEAPKIFFV